MHSQSSVCWQAHPEVPVVENLEDMWKVGKLQRERKARMEREEALQEQQQLKAKQATEVSSCRFWLVFCPASSQCLHFHCLCVIVRAGMRTESLQAVVAEDIPAQELPGHEEHKEEDPTLVASLSKQLDRALQ